MHPLGTSETYGYNAQPIRSGSVMPIEIEGVEYFTAADIQREVGVVRQTLWRWRRARKIPQGRRYRDKTIVFTRAEVETIREYSNRLEPAESPQPRQHGASATTPKGDARYPQKNRQRRVAP